LTTTSPPAHLDALGLLNALTHEEIVARLDQIEAEQKALRVLLRAVNRRERSRRRTPAGPAPALPKADAKAVPS
jgi:hypothetical protein